MIIEIIVAVVVVLAVWFGSKTVKEKEALSNVPGSVKRWKEEISQASGVTGVPEDIITGVLWTESAGNPDAVGSAGEIGLMQLKDIAVRDVEDIMGVNTSGWQTDPEVNVLIGAWYLKRWWGVTGSWDKAIMAYNQGLQGMKKYPERAQNYLAKVNSKRVVI